MPKPQTVFFVLSRLNKVAHTDVDPDQFEYEKEYVAQKTTEGIEGDWSGFAFYAKAKQNMVIKSRKEGIDNTAWRHR